MTTTLIQSGRAVVLVGFADACVFFIIGMVACDKHAAGGGIDRR